MASRYVSSRRGKDQKYKSVPNVEMEVASPPASLAAICLVFDANSSEPNDPKYAEAHNNRLKIVDRLKAADLLVTDNVVEDRKEAYVLVSGKASISE